MRFRAHLSADLVPERRSIFALGSRSFVPRSGGSAKVPVPLKGLRKPYSIDSVRNFHGAEAGEMGCQVLCVQDFEIPFTQSIHQMRQRYF
jgi:hypothetical protein